MVYAQEQTNGKGQFTKNWMSEPGKNLTVSLLFYPKWLAVTDQFMLNQALTNGVHQFITSILMNHVSIKWPNDIYYKNDKIAGILIENTISGNSLNSVIVGIGINVNQTDFDKEIPNATSLCKITDQQYDLMLLLPLLCKYLEAAYLKLKSGYNPINDYTNYLYKRDEVCTFILQNGAKMSGKILGVSRIGQLIVKFESGERRFSNGEIRFEV